MRTVITLDDLRRKIIEEAMGEAKSPGVTTIAHLLTISRLPSGSVSAAGANWEATDRAGNASVLAAIAKAQGLYDLY